MITAAHHEYSPKEALKLYLEHLRETDPDPSVVRVIVELEHEADSMPEADAHKPGKPSGRKSSRHGRMLKRAAQLKSRHLPPKS